jgi:mono/diheme cytochrome c family protein
MWAIVSMAGRASTQYHLSTILPPSQSMLSGNSEKVAVRDPGRRVPGRRRRLRALALAGCCWGTVSAADTDSALAAGRAAFEESCALCHGVDGRGQGAFAGLLKVAPPDLTALARSHGGSFPFSEVYRRIDGRDRAPAHGTDEMPIWGRRWLREGGDETYVRGRVLEIMLYLESLQAP